jgi:hypothetical protein
MAKTTETDKLKRAARLAATRGKKVVMLMDIIGALNKKSSSSERQQAEEAVAEWAKLPNDQRHAVADRLHRSCYNRAVSTLRNISRGTIDPKATAQRTLRDIATLRRWARRVEVGDA